MGRVGRVCAQPATDPQEIGSTRIQPAIDPLRGSGFAGQMSVGWDQFWVKLKPAENH